METLSIDELKKIELALKHKCSSMNERLVNGKIHKDSIDAYTESKDELGELGNKVRKMWQSELPEGRLQ